MNVLVIGAQNIDIFSSVNTPYKLKDSNPATIHMGFGGVGRNIAENLKRLGNDVHFLTIFADDFFAKAAKISLDAIGINTDQSMYATNQSNSIYMGIMDEDNDLFLGLNDMDIVKMLDETVITEKEAFINSFDCLVIDNNLKASAIKEITTRFHDKIIIIDAVSAKKVHKLSNLLATIDFLKLNHIELFELSGKDNVPDAIKALRNKGANTLIITNQASDIIVSSKNNTTSYKPIPIQDITNATGAGDAFISGFIHGTLQDYSIDKRIDYARSIAYLTLKSTDATSKTITINEVEKTNEKLHRI